MKKIIQFLLIVVISVAFISCQDDSNGKIRFINDYDIYTDTIRGHVYLHTLKGGLLHAPDCPCFTDSISNK